MLIALELLQRLGPLKAGAEWQRIFEKRGRAWVNEGHWKVWSPGRDLNS